MKGKTLFTLALLAFTCALIVESLTLSTASRAAPLWVLVPTALLLVARLVSPAVRPLRRARTANATEAAASRSFDARAVGGPRWSAPTAAQWRGARITGWLVLLLALIDTLGFFVAVPLFVAPYLRAEAGLRWRASCVFAAVLVGALYAVFGVWVDVSFPESRLSRMALFGFW